MRHSFMTKVLPTLLLAAGLCFSLETPAMACTETGSVLEFGIIMIITFPIISLLTGCVVLWMLFKSIQSILYDHER